MEEGRVVLEYCNDTDSGAAVFGTEEWGGVEGQRMMQWNPIDKKTAAKWGAKSRVQEENAFVFGRFVAGRRRIR